MDMQVMVHITRLKTFRHSHTCTESRRRSQACTLPNESLLSPSTVRGCPAKHTLFGFLYFPLLAIVISVFSNFFPESYTSILEQSNKVLRVSNDSTNSLWERWSWALVHVLLGFVCLFAFSDQSTYQLSSFAQPTFPKGYLHICSPPHSLCRRGSHAPLRWSAKFSSDFLLANIYISIFIFLSLSAVFDIVGPSFLLDTLLSWLQWHPLPLLVFVLATSSWQFFMVYF